VWQDLTLSPVVNDSNALNKFGMDISSIVIDRNDTTGNTAYLTVEGASTSSEAISVAYRTTDGGAHWTNLTANLPDTPASSIVVDSENAKTVYIATDDGSISQPRWRTVQWLHRIAGRYLEQGYPPRLLSRSAPLLEMRRHLCLWQRPMAAESGRFRFRKQEQA